jgi:hypothetical protein
MAVRMGREDGITERHCKRMVSQQDNSFLERGAPEIIGTKLSLDLISYFV